MDLFYKNQWEDTFTINNSIIYGNSGSSLYASGSAYVAIANSNIEDESYLEYIDDLDGLEVDGIISETPGFLIPIEYDDFVGNIGGDFSLEEGSECIDKGLHTYSHFDDEPMFVIDEDEISGCAPDLGANEYMYDESPDCEECIGFGLGVNDGDINNDGVLNVIDMVGAISLILSEDYNAVLDSNCDGLLNVIDIVFYVSLIL